MKIHERTDSGYNAMTRSIATTNTVLGLDDMTDALPDGLEVGKVFQRIGARAASVVLSFALTGCAGTPKYEITEASTNRVGVVQVLTSAAEAMIAECDRWAQNAPPGAFRRDPPTPNPTFGSTNRNNKGMIWQNKEGSRPLKPNAHEVARVTTPYATVTITATLPINPNNPNLALDVQTSEECVRNK
jgi:hypothetical protein